MRAEEGSEGIEEVVETDSQTETISKRPLSHTMKERPLMTDFSKLNPQMLRVDTAATTVETTEAEGSTEVVVVTSEVNTEEVVVTSEESTEEVAAILEENIAAEEASTEAAEVAIEVDRSKLKENSKALPSSETTLKVELLRADHSKGSTVTKRSLTINTTTTTTGITKRRQTSLLISLREALKSSRREAKLDQSLTMSQEARGKLAELISATEEAEVITKVVPTMALSRSLSKSEWITPRCIAFTHEFS